MPDPAVERRLSTIRQSYGDGIVQRTMPAAVCFDLDGTLLDGSGLQVSIERTCEAIAERQPALTANRLLQANSAEWRRYWPEIERHWETGALSGAAIGLEAWRRTLKACGSDDQSLAEFAADLHDRLAAAEHRLFDDAAQAVSAVRARRMAVALVTNGATDTQHAKLDALGIDEWFDAIVVTGEIGRAKPDVEPFRAALGSLEVEAAHAWHIGDSLATDVAGANAAGLTSVWLNRDNQRRREHDPVPDFEITSLRRLTGLLR